MSEVCVYILDMWDLALQGNNQAIFFFIALYTFIVCTYSVIFQYRVNHWHETKGKLIQHGLKKLGHDNIRSEENYTASAIYTYTVNDTVYVGKKVSTWAMTGSGMMKNIGNQQLKGIGYLPNDGVRVFFNPKKPHKSVLIRPGIISQTFTFSIGLIMLFSYYIKFYM